MLQRIGNPRQLAYKASHPYFERAKDALKESVCSQHPWTSADPCLQHHYALTFEPWDRGKPGKQGKGDTRSWSPTSMSPGRRQHPPVQECFSLPCLETTSALLALSQCSQILDVRPPQNHAFCLARVSVSSVSSVLLSQMAAHTTRIPHPWPESDSSLPPPSSSDSGLPPSIINYPHE